jgi:hypothetical protein
MKKEKVMIDKYKEGIDDFIKNHLDRQDFAFLVLPRDERLRHQAMAEIKDKFWTFWEAREDEECDAPSTIYPTFEGKGESDMKESVHGKVVGGGGVGGDIGNVHGNAGCFFSNVARVCGKSERAIDDDFGF